MLINLKPQAVRIVSATEVIRRLQPKLAAVPGIALFLQPVQDLTIENRVSRTQYQFTLGSVDPAELSRWMHRLVDRLSRAPAVADAASDVQDQGLAGVRVASTAARRAGWASPRRRSTMPCTTPSGSGWCPPSSPSPTSTGWCWKSKPEYRTGPAALNDLASLRPTATQVPLSAVAQVSERPTPLPSTTSASFRHPPSPSTWRRALRWARRCRPSRPPSRKSACRSASSTSFQGAALAFQASLTNTLLLILAAIVTMYIVLGVLYESYIHPVTILSTLPSAGVGALLALMAVGQRPRHHRHHRHHPADRHRQEKRHHDDRLRAGGGAQAGHAAAGGDLPGLPAALPARS